MALFRSAALLVLPYLDASQSALVAAAYAFSAPVIVTEAGALPEYVVAGATGWIVPAGDAAALTGVLRQALADPARLRQMGTRAVMVRNAAASGTGDLGRCGAARARWAPSPNVRGDVMQRALKLHVKSSRPCG